VLDAQGRVLEAEGDAQPRAARDALGSAARDVTKARGVLRRDRPEEALALWKALVAGQWSLVNYRDTDQKRLILARKNRPDVPCPRALTAHERAILALAVRGHSIKMMACELGLASSTVSERLNLLLRKLGLRHRAELSTLFGQPAARRTTADG